MMLAFLFAFPRVMGTASPSIPLERTAVGFYLVKVDLGNGICGHFVLDTGSYRSFVTSEGRQRLVSAQAKKSGNGELTPKRMILGGYPIPPVSFATDEEGTRNPIPKGFDGLLGNDVWSHFRMGLDLSKNTLGLWASGADLSAALKEWSPSAAKPVSSAPLGLGSDGSYYLPVVLDGRTMPFLLDTGATYSFVSDRSASVLGWSDPISHESIGYASGAVPITFYKPKSVEIGSLRLPATLLIGATRTDGNPATLGTDALLSLRTFLDFPGRRAYFLPIATPPDHQ